MWYSTHWIFTIEFTDSIDSKLRVLERVVLVDAFDEGEAFEKARHLAEGEMHRRKNVFYWDNRRRANLNFRGISRVCIVSTDESEKGFVKLQEGNEFTCWEFEVDNVRQIEALCNDFDNAKITLQVVAQETEEVVDAEENMGSYSDSPSDRTRRQSM